VVRAGALWKEEQGFGCLSVNAEKKEGSLHFGPQKARAYGRDDKAGQEVDGPG